LLPDAPIVAWWPNEAPESPSKSPLGRIAHRRITDSGNAADPRLALEHIAGTYAEGDTDLAWTRLTNWRVQLAAALDQSDGSDPITGLQVEGASDSSSTLLLASWLHRALDVPISVIEDPRGTGIRTVIIERGDGNVELTRPGTSEATLSQPGQPDQKIALPRRSLQDCLAEELRRLDPDLVFGEVVTEGLKKLLAEGKVTQA
jgi:glucose-6-phosphate dehydrogenase assembly protein OpcA